jgi:hypothetical protein
MLQDQGDLESSCIEANLEGCGKVNLYFLVKSLTFCRFPTTQSHSEIKIEQLFDFARLGHLRL